MRQNTLHARLGLDETGQDMAEYALLTALIAIVLIVVVQAVEGSISQFYTDIAGFLSTL